MAEWRHMTEFEKRMFEMLRDAEGMFRDAQRNFNTADPTGATRGQYKAMAGSIRKLLEEIKNV